MLSCSQALSTTQFDLMLMLFWSIWKARNDKLWNNLQCSHLDVIIKGTAALQAFHSTSHNRIIHPRQHVSHSWVPPSPGWLKVNVDGAFKVDSLRGGVGVVLRDFDGQFVAGFGTPMAHVNSAEHVEAMAVLLALQFVLNHGFQPITLESDSLIVVKACQSASPNLSMLGRIYDDIAALLLRLPGTLVHHVYRDANVAAHRLAQRGLVSSGPLSWINHPPDILVST